MTSSAAIKKVFLIQDSGGTLICDEFGEPREFKSARAALRFAKERLKEITDAEVWIFALSHVVSRPDLEPIVDVIP